jgi:glucosylceramidase
MKTHKIIVFIVIAALVGFRGSLLYAGSLVPGRDSSITSPRTALVYTTAKDTDKRLTLTDELIFEPGIQPFETETAIFVNPQKRFQKILGFGGAITDASSEVFAKLSDETQEELLKAYFDKDEGIGYNLIRTSIHSSDFGSASHTYIEGGR